MTQIKIINATMCSTKTDPDARRKRWSYLWECDNGSFYLTKDMAMIIGTIPESLVYKYRRYGICDKLLVASAGYKKVDANEIKPFAVIDALNLKLTCMHGDIVRHKGKKVSVNKVLDKGKESTKKAGIFYNGDRSLISAFRTMPDSGNVLVRSSFYIGDNWSHV